MTTTLVTGAYGQIGTHLVTMLEMAGHTVRRATSRPAATPFDVPLNLATGEGLTPALEGVDQVFLMVPPGYPNHDEIANPVIDAAKAAGVSKVLMLSALNANADESIPLRKAELHLERSGLTWNVIRPSWFMQNFNTFWLQGIKEQGQIFLPLGQAKGSFIDTRDISAVAATLLTTNRFDNQAFDLTGGESLDHHEVAAILSKVSGRSIGYTDIPEDAMRQGLLSAGLPADYTEFMLVILGAFKAGHAARTTDAVQRITGRSPISMQAYAQDFRHVWA